MIPVDRMASNTYALNSSEFNRDESNINLFFSTMHIRNELYESGQIEKIIEFYNSFQSTFELINWMKERPKGRYRIIVSQGDPDYLVVIPTIDHTSKFSQTCVNDIFRGMTVIFVESGRNLYFNYAYNVNAGIRYAMNLCPKWIIVSNDDMYKIDESESLIRELKRCSENNIQIALPRNGDLGYISKYRSFINWLTPIIRIYKPFIEVEKKFGIGYRFYLKEYKKSKKIENFIFIKKILPVKFLGSFFALSLDYCRAMMGKVFDDTYVNGFEDIDLVLLTIARPSKVKQIDYKIGDMGGQSLGRGGLRSNYKGILNRAYFNYKQSDFLSNIKSRNK